MSDQNTFQLYGRIILNGEIEALTGLHIGGSPGALAIGGVDLPVIRNPIDQKPYIPGSSLKGKMRSLWEKLTGAKQNTDIGSQVKIHTCKKNDKVEDCRVCNIYGSTGDAEVNFPTRIIVRDAPLQEASMATAKTDLPYSEVKWEATIDRVTSAAVPRQIERVPAGAIFEKMQIVFNIYEAKDCERFLDVLTALQLVEDDYLGGHGSRGSGRVAFRNLTLEAKSAANYTTPQSYEGARGDLGELIKAQQGIHEWLEKAIPIVKQDTNGGR